MKKQKISKSKKDKDEGQGRTGKNVRNIKRKVPPRDPFLMRVVKYPFKAFGKSDGEIIARMELHDGKFETLVVKIEGEGFIFKGGRYIIDEELMYYDKSYKSFCLDYHQGISFPIRRKIPKGAVLSALRSRGSDIHHAANPVLLERYENSKIIENILNATLISDFLRQLRIILFIAALSSVAHLLLWMYREGMFSEIL